MSLSSIGVELHHSVTADGEYTKFADVKDFPDMFGEPELIQTTTLSNKSHTYIPGVKDTGIMPFTINWDAKDAKKISDIEGKLEYWKLILPDNTEFAWSGYASLGIPGKGVNEALEAKLNIVPASDIDIKYADA